MQRVILFVAALAGASAFSTTPALSGLRQAPQACSLQMQADGVSRRGFFQQAAAAVTIAASPLVAGANVEYPNVPYLGGSEIVDINNANIRVYTKFPGMYPRIAGIIVRNGPYKNLQEMLDLPQWTAADLKVIDKYQQNLAALEPAPEAACAHSGPAQYVIDNFNNGLYR